MAAPRLQTIIDELGDVGARMWQLGAAEGAAGNLSVFVRDLDRDARFPAQGSYDLPVPAPALAGGWVIVTGSARRLRDVARAPQATLCLLRIHPGGALATIHAAPGQRPTSELNSHLAVHNDQVALRDLPQHAVVHAQPLRLTYLSHLPHYADTQAFNHALLRWQPETIIEFPEGVGVLPFAVPGTLDQTGQTVLGLRQHRAIIWRKHGVVARAVEVGKAGDLVEYLEAAARYEYLNLAAGAPAAGLSDAELRAICEQFGIAQALF